MLKNIVVALSVLVFIAGCGGDSEGITEPTDPDNQKYRFKE